MCNVINSLMNHTFGVQNKTQHYTPSYFCIIFISGPPRWRRGSGLDCASGLDSRHALNTCGPSDGKEVKDVFPQRLCNQKRATTISGVKVIQFTTPMVMVMSII